MESALDRWVAAGMPEPDVWERLEGQKRRPAGQIKVFRPASREKPIQNVENACKSYKRLHHGVTDGVTAQTPIKQRTYWGGRGSGYTIDPPFPNISFYIFFSQFRKRGVYGVTDTAESAQALIKSGAYSVTPYLNHGVTRKIRRPFTAGDAFEGFPLNFGVAHPRRIRRSRRTGQKLGTACRLIPFDEVLASARLLRAKAPKDTSLLACMTSGDADLWVWYESPDGSWSAYRNPDSITTYSPYSEVQSD